MDQFLIEESSFFIEIENDPQPQSQSQSQPQQEATEALKNISITDVKEIKPDTQPQSPQHLKQQKISNSDFETGLLELMDQLNEPNDILNDDLLDQSIIKDDINDNIISDSHKLSEIQIVKSDINEFIDSSPLLSRLDQKSTILISDHKDPNLVVRESEISIDCNFYHFYNFRKNILLNLNFRD